MYRVPLKWNHSAYFAVVIPNVFSKEECDELIRRADEAGYEEALVNIGGGRQQKMQDFRNNDRCIIDDPAFAQVMWQRVLSECNATNENEAIVRKLFEPRKKWQPVGINERLRFLRYKPGTFFRLHYDGSYVRGDEAGVHRSGEQSFVTVQLYLNEDFCGGETRFLADKGRRRDEYCVVPKTGSVLLFQHNLLHEGCPVVSGQKHVIRSDVMYTNKGPGHEYSQNPIVLGPLKRDSIDENVTKK